MDDLEFWISSAKSSACEYFLHWLLYVCWFLRVERLSQRMLPTPSHRQGTPLIGGHLCRERARHRGKSCRRRQGGVRSFFRNGMTLGCFRILPRRHSSFTGNVMRVSRDFGK